MSEPDEETRSKKREFDKKMAPANLDTGWLVEVVGATVNWLLNEPVISVLVLVTKGALQVYQRYLYKLPSHYRPQHAATRNTMLGSGLLMAVPLGTENTLLQWIIAYLIGVSIAWAFLTITGYTKYSYSRREYHAI